MNIADAIAEVQQPRSRFQLVHFVIGQHDTPEMCFYQLCLELQDMGFKLRLAALAVRKTLVEIGRLQATGDELDAIEAEEKQVGLEQTRIVMAGAEREIAILTDLHPRRNRTRPTRILAGTPHQANQPATHGRRRPMGATRFTTPSWPTRRPCRST